MIKLKKKLKNKTKLELNELTYQAHDIDNKNKITTKKANYNKL